MKSTRFSTRCWVTLCLISIGSFFSALAAPTITSVIPARMTGGVSPLTPTVFTFSEAMDPAATAAQFIYTGTSGGTYQFLSNFTTNWSSGNKVLSYTPTSPMPAGMIVWSLDGANPNGDVVSDGSFFTVAASDLGCDPQAPMLSFTVSKSKSFEQTSAGVPVASTTFPYCFLGCMTIPCPRTAMNVALRNPAGISANMALTSIPGHVQLMSCSYASQADLDQAYPTGDYLFTIQATSSNQEVMVNLPSSLSYPPAPHVANFSAAQAIDPSKPFTITWDAIPGGSSSQCVMFEIYGTLATPPLGEPGAMNGTASSFTIPANTLEPNQTYQCGLVFQNYRLATNTTGVTLAYYGAVTEFEIATTSGLSTPLVLTNAVSGVISGGTGFAFDVNCSAGQQLVAEYCTNLSLKSWQQLAMTNTTTTSVRFVDPRPLSSTPMFYRVRVGQ